MTIDAFVQTHVSRHLVVFTGTIVAVEHADPTRYPEVHVDYASDVTVDIEQIHRGGKGALNIILWPARLLEDGTVRRRRGWRLPEVGQRYVIAARKPTHIDGFSTVKAVMRLD